MKRDELTEKILDIKREKGWTWKHITDEIGGMIAGSRGRRAARADEAAEAARREGRQAVWAHPRPKSGCSMKFRRVAWPMPPTDPLLYRFYELVMVNGPALESADRGGIRRRHHVGDRLRSRARPARAMPKGDRVRLVRCPASSCHTNTTAIGAGRAGIRVQGGVTSARISRLIAICSQYTINPRYAAFTRCDVRHSVGYKLRI